MISHHVIKGLDLFPHRRGGPGEGEFKPAPFLALIGPLVTGAAVLDLVTVLLDDLEIGCEVDFSGIEKEFTARLDNDRALSAAMGNSAYLQVDEDFSVAVAGGFADGAVAGSLAGIVRVSKHAAIQGTIGFGEDEYAGRIGARQGW